MKRKRYSRKVQWKAVERMCNLAGVSCATFYRSLREQQPLEEDREVRSAIQEIALAHRRRYGYRRNYGDG